LQEVIIQAGSVTIRARLLKTPTAQAVWDALPMTATVKTWGEEIYFDVPVSTPSEPDARDVVKAGEIAYWPDGQAIGFGPTHISKKNEIRLVSPVNIWANAIDDVTKLISVRAGETVTITATEI